MKSLSFINEFSQFKHYISGRPWHPSVFAGAEKGVYSVTKDGVDLFAHDKKGVDVYQKETDANNVLEKMSLQAYLEQVSCYEQLLKPIADIMQKSLAAPRARNPSQGHASSPLSKNGSGQSPADKSDLYHSPRVPKKTLTSTLGPAGRELASAFLDLGIVHSYEDSMPSKPSRNIPKRSVIQLPRIEKPEKPNKVEDIQQPFKSASSLIFAPRNSLEPINSDLKEAAIFDNSAAVRMKKRKSIERRERKKYNRKSAVIPWDLLDTLDGEKKRFEKEKLYVEFHKKF